MKYISILIVVFAFISCGEQAEEESTNTTEDKNEVQATPKNFGEFIERELRLSPLDDYTVESYVEECTGDGKSDTVYTVNLLALALREAEESGNVIRRIEMGYMGNYNYLVVKDGMSGKYSRPVPIPSSPQAKLEIQFAPIVNGEHNDIIVDYRIRNSGFRAYFSMLKGIAIQVFQYMVFDGAGTSNPEAFYAQYEPGSQSDARDIVIYEGYYENQQFTDPDEVYAFKPEIKQSMVEVRRWFFRPNEYKYFTENN